MSGAGSICRQSILLIAGTIPEFKNNGRLFMEYSFLLYPATRYQKKEILVELNLLL